MVHGKGLHNCIHMSKVSKLSVYLALFQDETVLHRCAYNIFPTEQIYRKRFVDSIPGSERLHEPRNGIFTCLFKMYTCQAPTRFQTGTVFHSLFSILKNSKNLQSLFETTRCQVR